MASRLTALALIVAMLGLSRGADAFEIKHSAVGGVVRWRRDAVAWTLDRSLGLVPGGEEAAVAAIDAWTQRDGAPTLAVGARDATLAPGYDGTNAVFYAPSGFAPAGNALAVTVLTFDDETGEVLDADIVLNGRYRFGSVETTAPPSMAPDRGPIVYDVGRVLAHEMGHALALSDEPARSDALMYPYVGRVRKLASAPGPDDLAGIAALYGAVGGAARGRGGAPATSAGCTTAKIAPSSTPAARLTVLLGAGLVLVGIGLARRGAGRRKIAGGCAVVAAAALVIPLPMVAAVEAPPTWVVTSVRTTATNGMFRSAVELTATDCASSRCPPVSRTVAWGGTIGRTRQIVGGAPVPAKGDHVEGPID